MNDIIKKLISLQLHGMAACVQDLLTGCTVSGTSNPRFGFGSDLRIFSGDFTIEDFDYGQFVG